MIYLVFISLLLHLVSFFVIVILYQRIENQKPLDKEKTVKEIEDLLLSYTAEMKENNEKLAKRISELPVAERNQVFKNEAAEDARPEGTSPAQINKEAEGKRTPDSVRETGSEMPEKYSRYTPPVPGMEKEEESLKPSSTSKVLSLSKQGYSKDEIAKQLEMGAGEVELLLKFYK